METARFFIKFRAEYPFSTSVFERERKCLLFVTLQIYITIYTTKIISATNLSSISCKYY